MIEVNGIQPPVAPEPIEPTGSARPSVPPAEAAGPQDVIEISAAARLAAKVHAVPEVREELVQRVKDEIATGTYETPARIERAVTRLMEELLGNL
jgi:negative regulator of flagellin synthesis FlgM